MDLCTEEDYQNVISGQEKEIEEYLERIKQLLKEIAFKNEAIEELKKYLKIVRGG